MDKFIRVSNALQEKGYELAPGHHISKARKYLSATDVERAQDLINALCDPAIAAVICIRGGYGSGRLIPWLPFSSFRKNHKIFLGYSDITFLHLAFLGRMPWVTFHGPNLIEMADDTDLMDETLDTLSGSKDFSWTLRDDQILKHGAAATGKMIGGNLSCLTHLIGTPYFPRLDEAMLLLEDRGESLYRLDRFLTQIRLAGILQRLSGLVLGHFQDCGELHEIHAMILEQVKTFRFPVIGGLPFGHGRTNEVVPLGVPFLIDTHERVLRTANSPFNE
jgi:muramoyltetrapeptide carboxypeptidase